MYFGIIASIIVISFVTSLYKQSLKSFFTTFWSYLSVLLSDRHSIKAKNTFDRLFACLWLLFCTVLLSAFSGKLIEQVIKPTTIHWIDSWDDLHEWKHLSIQTVAVSEIVSFTKNNPNEPISKDFQTRFKVPDGGQADEDASNIMRDLLKWEIDIKGVKDGTVAVVYPEYTLQILKRGLISKDFKEDIDFHISESGRGSQPYFSLINKMSFNESFEKIINFG